MPASAGLSDAMAFAESVAGVLDRHAGDSAERALDDLGWGSLAEDPKLFACAGLGGVELGRRLAPLREVDRLLGGAPLAGELVRSLGAERVVLARVDGSELGDPRLDQATGLENARNLLEAKVGFRAQKLHRNVVREDEDPACGPGAHGEHAGVDEHAHGLAQRRAADLHRRGKVAFGGQPVPGVEFAEADALGDLLDRALERATRTDRDEGAFHAFTLPACAALVHSWYKSKP